MEFHCCAQYNDDNELFICSLYTNYRYHDQTVRELHKNILIAVAVLHSVDVLVINSRYMKRTYILKPSGFGVNFYLIF